MGGNPLPSNNSTVAAPGAAAREGWSTQKSEKSRKRWAVVVNRSRPRRGRGVLWCWTEPGVPGRHPRGRCPGRAALGRQSEGPAAPRAGQGVQVHGVTLRPASRANRPEHGQGKQSPGGQREGGWWVSPRTRSAIRLRAPASRRSAAGRVSSCLPPAALCCWSSSAVNYQGNGCQPNFFLFHVMHRILQLSLTNRAMLSGALSAIKSNVLIQTTCKHAELQSNWGLIRVQRLGRGWAVLKAGAGGGKVPGSGCSPAFGSFFEKFGRESKGSSVYGTPSPGTAERAPERNVS